MSYLALFYTHSGSIKFQRFLQAKAIEVNLMPTPRKLSSNCGIAARFYYEGSLEDLVSEDLEKVYTVSGNMYNLVFENR
jgi:hypothetical protein